MIQQLPEWKGHEWNYKELKSSGGGGAWAELEALGQELEAST